MQRLLIAVLAAGFVGIIGCSAADEVDNAVDCQSICDRYKSCFDSDYDVGACAERCRDNSNEDKDFQRKANVCNACIDDRSCSSATFGCATDCAGVVP